MAGIASNRTVKRLLLVGAHGGVLLGPLVLVDRALKPGAQGRLVVFADALGFAALSLLALQVLVSGRWAATTRHLGLRRVLALHRHAGAAVLIIVIAHVLVLFIDNPARLALLDAETAPGRARAGVLAALGLVALAVTSIWRKRLRLSYQRWRWIHLALTALVIAAAFVHVLWVDAYMSLPAVRWSVLGLVLFAALALFWARVAGAFATALRPYRVVAVRRERGDAVTIELAADGHGGMAFGPGQFARLRPAQRPYSLDDHPFTISSSAERPTHPAFTIKALGDFSTSIAALAVGTAVLVDGPHGEAIGDARARRGRLLLAAGIGITPANEATSGLAAEYGLAVVAVVLLAAGGGWLVSGQVLSPLARAIATQRRFVANASHELRTPMTAIRVAAEVALEDPAPTVRELQAVLRETITTTEQTDRMMTALLTLASTVDGAREDRLFELGATVARVLPSDPRIDAAFESTIVRGDPILLGRAAANLLDNALRHGPAESTVVVRVRDGELTVSNAGHVIAPDDLERLPQPFERLGRGSQPGTGLGLSIVKAIAEAHGGGFTLESPPAGGLIARFAIPPAQEVTGR